jgi:hypothetical protein
MFDSESEVTSPSATKVTNVPHNFRLTDLLVPATCYVCDEIIWGLTDQGFECSMCAMTAHRYCASSAPKNCHLDSTIQNVAEERPKVCAQNFRLVRCST